MIDELADASFTLTLFKVNVQSEKPPQISRLSLDAIKMSSHIRLQLTKVAQKKYKVMKIDYILAETALEVGLQISTLCLKYYSFRFYQKISHKLD